MQVFATLFDKSYARWKKLEVCRVDERVWAKHRTNTVPRAKSIRCPFQKLCRSFFVKHDYLTVDESKRLVFVVAARNEKIRLATIEYERKLV
jgi:hypothetical protein